MQLYFTRYILIAKLAALTLSALCFLQAPVRAQGMPGYIVIFPSVGLAPGQILRLTLFKPDGAPVRAQAQIHHSGGILVGLGDGSVRSIRAGAFHPFDFKRSDIPLEGEEGTGRIQLSASFYISISEPQETIDRLAFSMETISISDGTSNTIFTGQANPSGPIGGSGNDTLSSGFGNDIMMGFVPGQTLRVTLSNPTSSWPEAQREPVSGHVKVFDGSGNLIAQSAELVIPPGKFRSFDFNRDALALPGTGRLQVRIKPFFDFESKRLPGVGGNPWIHLTLASFEIVDNSTGKTMVLSGEDCIVLPEDPIVD